MQKDQCTVEKKQGTHEWEAKYNATTRKWTKSAPSRQHKMFCDPMGCNWNEMKDVLADHASFYSMSRQKHTMLVFSGIRVQGVIMEMRDGYQKPRVKPRDKSRAEEPRRGNDLQCLPIFYCSRPQTSLGMMIFSRINDGFNT